jgi:hypothetical protein
MGNAHSASGTAEAASVPSAREGPLGGLADPFAGKGVDRLVASLEDRAVEAEKKIDELTRRMEMPGRSEGRAVGAGAGADGARAYVEELKALRGILVEADEEHRALLAKVEALEKTKSKLEYQVMHLKRAADQN